MNQDILKILNSDIFKKITSCQILQVAEINAVITLLIKCNIPFDLSFTPGDQRIAKEATLIIHITPAVEINFLIQFEAGSTVL